MVDADSIGSGRLVVFPTTSAIYHCFIVERRTVSDNVLKRHESSFLHFATIRNAYVAIGFDDMTVVVNYFFVDDCYGMSNLLVIGEACCSPNRLLLKILASKSYRDLETRWRSRYRRGSNPLVTSGAVTFGAGTG